MTQADGGPNREGGETLIEVTISILIMGIVFVAIMSGFGTDIGISVIHKSQATEQTIARDFGEYLQDASVGYSAGCGATYNSAVGNFADSYQLPNNSQPLKDGSYAIRIDSVQYLKYSGTGTNRSVTYSTSCTDESGAQLISYTVYRPNDTSSVSPTQSLQVVKRG